jgi:hypothetical protein
MATKPFFMMSQAEIEKLLPKDPKGREQALKSLEHSFSIYDFAGNHKPHPHEKENLLEVIGQRDAYVIDSNSDWRKLCKEYPDKAFIITPALSRENPNTKELILEATRSKLGNLFSVGIDASLECVLVDRIDEQFRHCFDNPKLSEASRGKGEIVKKQKVAIWKTIEQEKKLIRDHIKLAFLVLRGLNSPIVSAFLASGNASDLPSPAKIPGVVGLLKADVQKDFRIVKTTLETPNTQSRFAMQHSC